MLTDADRADLRREITPSLTARAEIQHMTRVKTGPATYEDTWATLGGQAAVPCKFRPAAAPREIIIADAQQAVAQFEVVFPVGTPIDTNHRLVITHAEPGVPSPLTLDVIGPLWRTGEVMRRVLAERVGGPA